jgi:hypothetical protein
MGLLEDAIREHLDLKRQHGADPGDVAAEERDALGPVQRGAEPLVVDEEEPLEDGPAAHDEPVHEAPVDFDFDEPVAPHEDVPPQQDIEPREDAGEPPPPPPSSAPFDFEDEPFAPERPAPEEEASSDEDVLEETPEFLQETPEHDRLWFEQKPPRDFDFDR